jgi:hypothetical protein
MEYRRDYVVRLPLPLAQLYSRALSARIRAAGTTTRFISSRQPSNWPRLRPSHAMSRTSAAAARGFPVRCSELKQALRSGREREEFGILCDARHWEQDLQNAILDASYHSPLAVASLDMNGLKAVITAPSNKQRRSVSIEHVL